MRVKFPKTIFLLSVMLLFSCSKEDNGIQSDDIPIENEDITVSIDAEAIEISIENNSYLISEVVTIALPPEVNHDFINVYLNSELIQKLTDNSLSFEIDFTDIQDGVYELKIEIIAANEVIGRKTLNVKIDYNGPVVDFGHLLDDNLICGNTILSPEIVDAVSKVSSVKVFLEQTQIAEFTNSADYSVVIDTQNLPLGERYLRFEMLDERRNMSQDSVQVKFAKKMLQINFPDGFVRPNVDEMHVILSKPDGSFVSSVTHSSGIAESLSICSTVEFEDTSEFILTFITDFQDKVYSIFPYHNLTLNSLGSEITLANRARPLSSKTVEIELPDYEEGDYIRSSGPWSSALNYQGNVLSGHFSSKFTYESLDTESFFIMNFNPDIERSYKWAFIENPHTFFKLKGDDFSSNNVVYSNLNIVGTGLAPFLSIYGFENESHFDSLVAHMLYWNPRLNQSNGYDFGYPDTFYDIFHSVKVSNYSIEGLGAPPSIINVPDKTIDYTFENNKLSFSGSPDFEVGRAQFNNLDDAHVFVEMFFDGSSEELFMPELPSFLGSQVVDIVNGGSLEIKQVVVEDYATIANYNEYISKIVVPSVPFYTVSPSRERIFKSSVSTSLLPMTEFPFHERF